MEAPFVRVVLRRGRILRIKVPDLDDAVAVARAWRERAPDDARAFEGELVRRAQATPGRDPAVEAARARRLTRVARIGALTLLLGVGFLVAAVQLGTEALTTLGRAMAALGVVAAVGASVASLVARWRELRWIAWSRTRGLWVRLAREA